MPRVVRIANLIVLALILAVFGYLTYLGYPRFLDLIQNLIGGSNNHSVESIITDSVFYRLKTSLLGLGLLCFISWFWSAKIYPLVAQTLQLPRYYFNWLTSNYRRLNKTEKLVFLVFILGSITIRLVLSAQTDVIYDEAWTYLAFTEKNPLVAAVFYPTSNNHILFSHLTQLCKLLPFSILTSQRMAALIPCVLALTNVYFYLRKRFNFLATLTALVFVSCLFPITYYGFVARGYALILFFFTCAIVAIESIMNNMNARLGWLSLAVSCALGCYTIPVFIYPVVTLFLWVALNFVINRNLADWGKFFKYGVLFVAFTFLCFAPIFVVSGIASVTQNKFVLPLSYSNLFAGIGTHFQYTARFFAGNLYWLVFIGILLLFLVTGLIFNKKQRSPLLFSVLCFIMMPVFIILHKVIPVERTWIYLLVPIAIIIASVAQHISRPVIMLVVVLAFSTANFFNWQPHMLWYDTICEEDYLQGQYFSKYFHNKNAHILTYTRMNSYLRFNQKLNHEPWIIEERSDSLKKGMYGIRYLKDTKPPVIQPQFKLILTHLDYELYRYDE
jgi:hypothetical protein